MRPFFTSLKSVHPSGILLLHRATAARSCVMFTKILHYVIEDMSFQNEEGLPLVEEQSTPEQKFSYKIASAIFLGICAATAYTSYNAGYNKGNYIFLTMNFHTMLTTRILLSSLLTSSHQPSQRHERRPRFFRQGYQEANETQQARYPTFHWCTSIPSE